MTKRNGKIHILEDIRLVVQDGDAFKLYDPTIHQGREVTVVVTGAGAGITIGAPPAKRDAKGNIS